MTGILHEDVFTFMKISPDLFLEREMFRIKMVEKIKIHILSLIPLSENHAFMIQNSKNLVEPERRQMAM
jgi:hypothetical protein